MGIDTRIPSRSRQRLIVLVRNVLSCLGISVPFCQAKIDYVNDVLFLSVANQEIIRLHIPMNEVIVVEELESLDHLVSNHKSCFDSELALAEVEGVF